MTFAFRRPAVSATALLLGLAAGPAFAAVTAQDVWDDWKGQMAIYGESAVTVGSEDYSGGVLTVTDLAFDIAGEDGSTASGVLPQLVMTENGDGTVTVTMSEEYPIHITTVADPEEDGSQAGEVDLAFRQTGLSIAVSGEPGALLYDVAASRYAVEIDRVTEGGVEVPAEMLVALNDVSGSYTSTVGATRDVTYDLAAATMDLLVDVTSPEDGSRAMLSGKVEGLSTQAAIAMPVDPATDPEMMMMAGFAMEGGYTTEAGSYVFEVEDPESGPTSGTIATGGGMLDFAVSKDAVSYRSSTTGVEAQVTAAAMPMPIAVGLGEVGATFEMPLSRTEAPAPWAMGLTLSQLAIDEQIWAMFDPQSMLSHDPATVRIDLTGTATMLFDVLDPSQTEAMEAAPMPAQVDSVSLDALEITFGGASVTGSGAFTLDNADTTTLPGMPKPTGAIDLQLDGVNGLLDALIAMGLLPEDQAMAPRMMMGMFTTAVGEDQLTSRIEFTEDGQILANGQRIQ